jgi:predicted SPOUT superfamily RNA methylase MTH1
MDQARADRRISIAIPASLVSDTPHLREKTAKLGSVARACSIFGVNEIILYPDDELHNQKADLEFCMEILRFVETPQYLRKNTFGISPNLRFTGILPPLQTPPHDVPHSIQESKVGEIREGIVVDRKGSRLSVDVGLGQNFECSGEYAPGRRVTVKITNLGNNPVGEILAELKQSVAYWGYKVVKADSSLARINEKENFDLTIGTSRYGTSIAEAWLDLAARLETSKRILIVFGSPKNGLREILRQENKEPKDVFDYFINAVPNQNVSTVRTEEAILISLGVFNLATSIY